MELGSDEGVTSSQDGGSLARAVEDLAQLGSHALATHRQDLALLALQAAYRAARGCFPRGTQRRISVLADLAVVQKEFGYQDRASRIERAVLAHLATRVPADDQLLCRTRMNAALSAHMRGDHDAALELALPALHAVQNSPRGGKEQLPWMLVTTGGIQFALGRFDQAESCFREALRTAHPPAADEVPDTHWLNARINLAGVLRSKGRHAEANVLAEQNLQLVQRHRPPGDRSREIVESFAAASLDSCGRHEKALAIKVELRNMVRTWRPHALADHIRLTINVAASLGLLGRHRDAIAELESILEPCSHLSPDDPILLQARTNRALAWHQIGEFDRARTELGDVLEAWHRRTGGERPLAVLQVEVALAAVELDRGAYLEATQRLSSLRVTIESVTELDSPEVADVTRALAVGYVRLGDLEAARLLSQRVVDLESERMGAEHPDVAVAVGNLALTLSHLGALRQATELQVRAECSLADSLDAADPRLLMARVNLAASLAQLGQGPRARELFSSVIHASGANSPWGRTARVESARLAWLDEGRDAEALVALTAVAQDLDAEGRSEDVLVRIARTCSVLIHAGARRWSEAQEVARLLVEDLEQRMLQVRITASRREAESIAAGARSLVSALVSAALTGDGDAEPGLVLLALRALETLRSAPLAPLTFGHTDTTPEIEALRRELAERSAAIAGSLSASAAFVAEQLLKRDEVERRLRTLLRSERIGVERFDPRVTAASLQADEALIAYAVIDLLRVGPGTRSAEAHLVAFVLSSSGIRLEDLGPALALVRATTRWLDAARADSDIDAACGSATRGCSNLEWRAGVRVREAILDALLSPELRRLVIVPDGVVHQLPLEALPLEDGVVGDRYEVTYSPTVAPSPAACSRKPGGLVCIGAVDYGPPGVDLDTFEPLPESASEIAAVRDRFLARHPDLPCDLLTERDADRKAWRRHAASARFVHIATHGFSAADADHRPRAASLAEATGRELARRLSPLALCGLAMASANASASGCLGGEELATSDLSGAELVVLAACVTSRGHVRPALGIASLAAAFHVAGAVSVIASSEPVLDDAAAELTAHFYDALWRESLDASRALWSAKCALRSRGARTYEWAFWRLFRRPSAMHGGPVCTSGVARVPLASQEYAPTHGALPTSA